MKASELAALLNEMVELYGDYEVFFPEGNHCRDIRYAFQEQVCDVTPGSTYAHKDVFAGQVVKCAASTCSNQQRPAIVLQ